MKLLLAILIALIMPAVLLGQTRQRQLSDTERQLIALSRPYVAKSVGSATVTVNDRFTGRFIAEVTSKTAELISPKVTIAGDRGLVTGRVIFNEGSPNLHRPEESSPVILSFVRRAGRWQLVDLCLGACSL